MSKELVKNMRAKASQYVSGHTCDLLTEAADLIESLTTPKVSHCTACGKEIPYTEHIDNRQCLKHLQIYT